MYFNKSYAVCNSTFMHKVVSEFYIVSTPVFNDPSRFSQMNWDKETSQYCHHGYSFIGRSWFAPALMYHDVEYITTLKRFLHQSVLILKPEIQTLILQRLAAAGFKQGTSY